MRTERPRRIVTRNTDPDLKFALSINPYRGCAIGCAYCIGGVGHERSVSGAKASEASLFARVDAARTLRRDLSATGYRATPIAIGTLTDPYQPIERHYRITRELLEVFAETEHPVAIVTKSDLVLRDLDLLRDLAERRLVKVAVSLSTLDLDLAEAMEPDAPPPARRLEVIRALSEAGVPVAVMLAPIIPSLNEAEIERILDAARAAGAIEAGYTLLRLPGEISEHFADWLLEHRPERYEHVTAMLREMEAGRARSGAPAGPFAWMIGRRFELAAERLGFGRQPARLRTDLFRAPHGAQEQMRLV